jgi:Ni,Fe-hydrogenase III large subunit
VETSALLIDKLADYMCGIADSKPKCASKTFTRALNNTQDFDVGLGYVEGWRGEVFYFVMKGPNNTIFRCQPRDPSLFNWPALRQAVIRRLIDCRETGSRSDGQCIYENIVADFPVINKSFNLSYAGNDG